MAANDQQIGGDHYRNKKYQPWDVMQDWMTTEQFTGFLIGAVIKYIARYRNKTGLEDLKKARHFLDKLIESEESALATNPKPCRTFPDRQGSGSLRCVCYVQSLSDPARECPIHPFPIGTYP